ncbi:hypothetical protein CVT26_012389 [Gymnopilus dilepis]|uniref:Uncharacterized protein n=1 Tax=Gymnopilus dilepis TaxID=231916 RepID=A0A409WVM1_9AGAR|nr:hypothetical protein CVT26_012389 [Gymnopilus dilepis]
MNITLGAVGHNYRPESAARKRDRGREGKNIVNGSLTPSSLRTLRKGLKISSSVTSSRIHFIHTRRRTIQALILRSFSPLLFNPRYLFLTHCGTQLDDDRIQESDERPVLLMFTQAQRRLSLDSTVTAAKSG